MSEGIEAQGSVMKTLSMYGRCVVGVITRPCGELAAHRRGLVTVPVSNDCGELACVSDQGDRSWHARVWRTSRGVLLRNTCLVPRGSSWAMFVASKA